MELETTTGVMLTLEKYNALQARLALLEEERDIWMNVYPDSHFVLWPTKEIAEEHYQTGRLVLVHLRMNKGTFVPYTFMPEADSQSDAAEDNAATKCPTCGQRIGQSGYNLRCANCGWLGPDAGAEKERGIGSWE